MGFLEKIFLTSSQKELKSIDDNYIWSKQKEPHTSEENEETIYFDKRAKDNDRETMDAKANVLP